MSDFFDVIKLTSVKVFRNLTKWVGRVGKIMRGCQVDTPLFKNKIKNG